MTPSYSMDAIENSVFGNAIIPGKPFLSAKPASISAPNFFRLRFSQLSIPLFTSAKNAFGMFFESAFFAAWVIAPIFYFLVHHIVASGSQEKMIRVDARRIVALMADAQSIWDWSVCNYPSYAMGSCNPAIECHAPISVPTASAGPFFAGSLFSNVRGEPTLKFLIHSVRNCSSTLSYRFSSQAPHSYRDRASQGAISTPWSKGNKPSSAYAVGAGPLVFHAVIIRYGNFRFKVI